MRVHGARSGATLSQLLEYVAELDKRATGSQADARRTLNPLFRDDRKRPPRDFVDSSFLYMRSCDADIGSRPAPCTAFWLSPDLRVAPLANLGTPTRELTAGTTYRLTATVRNRGDLPVPSAKVEFYLCNATLGFDTRFATKLGVAAGRVHAHSASEVSLDYAVPPALSGHRCLFARVFSFSPLDVPIDDFALRPGIDRHVAQLNLDIVAQSSSFLVDWIHLRAAEERLEVVPMEAPTIRALRREVVTPFALVDGARWQEVQGKLRFEVKPAEGPGVETRETDAGLELISRDPDAVPLERQAELTKQVMAAVRALETGRGDAARFKELFKEYRAMTAESVRTQVTLVLPDVGLERDEALALHVIKRGIASDEATGGIGLLITGDM